MAVTFIKKSLGTPTSARSVTEDVKQIIDDIDQRGEAAVIELSRRFDQWSGDIVLSDKQRSLAASQVPQQVREDIAFAHEQIRAFALAQRNSIGEFETTTLDGAILGQVIRPIQRAGCYVPGGRYVHIASALMSITTAKVAGVQTIIACSPPGPNGIEPAVIHAMNLAGADIILQLGGVQAIATLVHGLFTGQPVDIVVGPGNSFVAEAKRQFFGKVAIDVIAGPTESAIIADSSADPLAIAIDLVSQAEHGVDSPVWLFTTSRTLAERVGVLVEQLIADLPNPQVARQSWAACGEILLGDNREEILALSDRYAPEHLQIMVEDEDWWIRNLNNFGSLFVGDGCTVAHGDKCSGTNHILPTSGAARYSGGLNVMKFLKILTYQKLAGDAIQQVSEVASRISRLEGMEGHARACDYRLTKYFPETAWNFDVHHHKVPD